MHSVARWHAKMPEETAELLGVATETVIGKARVNADLCEIYLQVYFALQQKLLSTYPEYRFKLILYLAELFSL